VNRSTERSFYRDRSISWRNSAATEGSSFCGAAQMGEAQSPMGTASARIVANGLSQRGNGFFELLVNGWI
jgi:hypothetical protein